MTVSLQAQGGVTLSTDIPGAGSIGNITASDTTYLITGTSSGSAFAAARVDFPARWTVSAVSVLGALWDDSASGGVGVATWTIEYSKDNGATWPQWSQFATTGFGAQSFGAFTGLDVATNVRVRLTGYGFNGQAWIDEFRLTGDKGEGAAAVTLGAVACAGAGTVDIKGDASPTLGSLALAATGTVAVRGVLALTLAPVAIAADGYLDQRLGVLDALLGPVAVVAALFKWDPPAATPQTWTPTASAPALWSDC